MAYVYSIGADEALAGAHGCCSFDNSFDLYSTLYWVGGAVGDTTNWHNALNWAGSSGGTGGAGTPTINTTVIFDTGSNGYNCTGTAAMNCESVACTGWTKDFNTAGFVFTVNGVCNLNGTGSVLANGSTWNMYGNITFAASLTAFTPANMVFYIKANLTLNSGKPQTAGSYIKQVFIDSGITFTSSAGYSYKNDGGASFTLADSTSTFYLYNAGISIYSNSVAGAWFKPVVDNGGKIYSNTGYALDLFPTANSNYYLPKIDSLGALPLRITLGNTNTIVNCKATADINCRAIYLNGGSSATVTMDFDTYAFTGSLSVDTTYNTNNVFNVYMGTSQLHTSTNILLYSGSTRTINLYFQSCKINYTGASLSFFANGGILNVDRGTSTISFTGTTAKTLTMAGRSLYNVVVNTNHATNTFDFLDTANIYNLQIKPNTIVRMKGGLTHTISTYNAGDWNGTAGNLVTIKSVTDGQQHTLANPAGMNVSYVAVRDSVATNDITALLTNGNVNNGNNVKWIFTTAAFKAFWALSVNRLLGDRV